MAEGFTDYTDNIRDILGFLVGRRVVDVTQHDPEEHHVGGKHYVMLMFDDGSYAKFYIGKAGFWSFDASTNDESANKVKKWRT